MKGISGYEQLILALTAGFIALCAVLFFWSENEQRYTLTVSDRAPEDVFQTESVQKDGTPDSLIPGEQIDINFAPPAELARLPGIGESRAQAITAYREANGPFQSIDDLLQVNGIGAVTLEKLRSYVTVG